MKTKEDRGIEVYFKRTFGFSGVSMFLLAVSVSLILKFLWDKIDWELVMRVVVEYYPVLASIGLLFVFYAFLHYRYKRKEAQEIRMANKKLEDEGLLPISGDG